MNKNQIETAVELLKVGQLVAFPTETVYGLGADATNEQAVLSVFNLKNRPIDHPLIVHIPSIEHINKWADVDRLPAVVFKLAEAFWPGPLTIIVKKAKGVSDLITAKQDTVALRIPNHPLTLELLKIFDSGLVGPSANKFSYISPTTCEHVISEFGDKVFVLDGGECSIGIESTIVSVVGGRPIILRKGFIGLEQLQDCLGVELEYQSKDNNAIKAPGSLDYHYAPKATVYLAESHKLNSLIKNLQNNPNIIFEVLLLHKDPEIYAKNLYANLRGLDDKLATNCRKQQKIIVVEIPEQENLSGIWLAVYDRLSRASSLY